MSHGERSIAVESNELLDVYAKREAKNNILGVV